VLHARSFSPNLINRDFDFEFELEIEIEIERRHGGEGGSWS
jgi:hypothetical protein